VRWQAARREEQVLVVDQTLEEFPPRPEGVIAQIAPAGLDTIKGDVDWWRHQGVRVWMQEGATGQEVLIKRSDFPRAREHRLQGHWPTGLAARSRQADDHHGHRAGSSCA
jgi:hypothetical protein